MEKLNNQEIRDAGRKADFIFHNLTQYESDPIFRSMVDGTVYITHDERIGSMAIIGGRYNKAGQFLGL